MLAARFEELPDLPPSTAILLAILLAIWWVAMRIRILRRRQARRGSGEPPVEAWRWLRWLAARPWILPALLALAVLVAAGCALSLGLATGG